MLMTGHRAMEPDQLAAEPSRERDGLIERQSESVALQARVVAYEQRFGMSSDQVHAAIDRGALEDTPEVCEWIIDYELLQRLASPR